MHDLYFYSTDLIFFLLWLDLAWSYMHRVNSSTENKDAFLALSNKTGLEPFLRRKDLVAISSRRAAPAAPEQLPHVSAQQHPRLQLLQLQDPLIQV